MCLSTLHSWTDYFLFHCRCNRGQFSPFCADHIHLVSCTGCVSGWRNWLSVKEWHFLLQLALFSLVPRSAGSPKHISFEKTLKRDQPEPLRTIQWCVFKIIILLSMAISLPSSYCAKSPRHHWLWSRRGLSRRIILFSYLLLDEPPSTISKIIFCLFCFVRCCTLEIERKHGERFQCSVP